MVYIKIVIDAFGGDFAPTNVLKAVSLVTKKKPYLQIILSGNEPELLKTAKNLNINISQHKIISSLNACDTTNLIHKVLKEKFNSSMIIGLEYLNLNDVDAFITAGNTATLAVGSRFLNKKINGVKRAALCATLPSYEGKFLLLDAGANLQCREDSLVTFAIMGSIYAEKILNINNPKIGLANVGSESFKGLPSHKNAFNILSNLKNINFIGNVEARYIPFGLCDVVIADGLSGNMILKTMEGTAKCLMKNLKDLYSKNLKTKIAAKILKEQHNILKQKLDYKNYGGAIFLGMEKPIIKAHGNSNAKTLEKTIFHTITCVKQKINLEIEKKISTLKDIKIVENKGALN